MKKKILILSSVLIILFTISVYALFVDSGSTRRSYFDPAYNAVVTLDLWWVSINNWHYGEQILTTPGAKYRTARYGFGWTKETANVVTIDYPCEPISNQINSVDERENYVNINLRNQLIDIKTPKNLEYNLIISNLKGEILYKSYKIGSSHIDISDFNNQLLIVNVSNNSINRSKKIIGGKI